VSQGTKENYLALLICIVRNKSVNKALQDMFGAVEQEVQSEPIVYTEYSRRIQEMRRMRQAGMKYSKISEEYNIPLGTVYYYINGKTRKHKK
jgi:hypothetical protein